VTTYLNVSFFGTTVTIIVPEKFIWFLKSPYGNQKVYTRGIKIIKND